MKKKFLLNLLLLLCLNLLIKPFWVFGIEVSVQNLVGSSAYGFYFSLFNFSLMFNIFLDAGLTNFNNRAISQNPGKFTTFFFNILGLKMALALVYLVIAFIVAFALGYDSAQFHLLLFLCFNQFLLSLLLLLRSNISGLQFFTLDSMLSVLDRLIMIILAVFVIWGHILHRAFEIFDFVKIQTVSYSFAIIVVGLVLLRNAPPGNFSFNRKEMFKILRLCLPFALLGFLMSVYNRLDGVMLERMLVDGKMHAGVYAQSFRILDAVSMFAFLFPTLLLPMFSSLLGKRMDVTSLLRLSYSILFVVSVIFSLTCAWYSKEIITALYHEHNAYSSEVFRILILGFIPISTCYIFGTLLTANGSLRQLNILSFLALAFNFILNLIFIRIYQAKGAAMVSLVTQLLVASLQIFYAIRILNVNLQKAYIIKLAAFFVITLFTIWCLHFLPIIWYIQMILTAVLLLILSLITNVLPFRDAIKLFLQKQIGD